MINKVHHKEYQELFSRASLQESQKESQYAIYYYIYKCKKNKKVIQIFYKDLSTRYDSFFDYDENSLTNEKIEQVLAFQT